MIIGDLLCDFDAGFPKRPYFGGIRRILRQESKNGVSRVFDGQSTAWLQKVLEDMKSLVREGIVWALDSETQRRHIFRGGTKS